VSEKSLFATLCLSTLLLEHYSLLLVPFVELIGEGLSFVMELTDQLLIACGAVVVLH
jgi:hypothetical protein